MIAPQLPLPIPHAPQQRFDSFVDAPEGLLPWLQALAEGRADPAQGYLQGAPGSGKTHLLLATCAHARERGISAVYLPLARLGARAVDALAATDAAALVAVDDIDRAAAVPQFEQALFDAHNRLRQQGAGLLYSANNAPAQLPLQLPDLRSRLGQCTRMLLPMLDDAGLARLLKQSAASRGLVLEEAAIDWLLRRVGRDAGTLSGLLETLDAASLAAQRRVTVPFLRKVLAVPKGISD